MTLPAISIQNLSKTYKGTKKSAEKKALDNVSIDVPQGSIFGLLGPNGAGKSTLINILAGLVIKTSGTANIYGYDIIKQTRQSKLAIGIVPQELNYDPFFTPRELLETQAGLYGVPKSERRTAEILETVGLSDKAEASTRSLSGGMVRRLMIAKAMVHTPPVLILDEPTAGVDVDLRKQLWNNVRRLNQQGTTIVLTTHYLEEAEELCDRIAIINHGKIITNERKEDLISKLDGKRVRFFLDKKIPVIPEPLQDLNVTIKEGDSIVACYSPEDHDADVFINAIHAAGYSIKNITTRERDLEDVFLDLTGMNTTTN